MTTLGTTFRDRHGSLWTVVGFTRGLVVARDTDGWTRRFYASVVEEGTT